MSYTDEFLEYFSCDAPLFTPSSILDLVEFISCIDMKKTRYIYVVKIKETNEKAILKITEKSSPDHAKCEHEILSLLNHEGIPKSIMFCTDDEGREYLVRSYVEGDTLNRLLDRDGIFSELYIYAVIRKLCTILAYLHSQHPPIIYQDIKPQNIILTQNGKVSLIDFGISKRIKNKDKSFETVYVGPLKYIPPEQMGFGKTDHRSDIFSLGKLMLHLYTGHTKWAEAFEEIDKKTSIYKIIKKCTHLSPEKRYSSIKQVERAIDKAQTAPQKFAFAKGIGMALLFAFFVMTFLTNALNYNLKRTLPLETYINLGLLDEELQIKSEILIKSARNSLGISKDAKLTNDMINKITSLTIKNTQDEETDKSESFIGIRSNQETISHAFLSELKYFSNLSELTLEGLNIQDISQIADISLKTLDLSNNQISYLGPINKMLTLEKLNLSYNPIEDIRPLAGLMQLSELNLSYTNVRDIYSLEKLANLQSLCLLAGRVTDLKALSNLTDLKTLKISHAQIRDFSFLTQLTNIIYLELRSTGFSDLSFIKSDKLIGLDISLNYNYLNDISDLMRFTDLQMLDISLNEIKNFDVLYKLKQLRILGLHDEQIAFLTHNFGDLIYLNKIILTADELKEEWKNIDKDGKIKIVIRPYSLAY